MSRPVLFVLFFLAVFLQSGTYGLTFMLPELFAAFDANEKDVGEMLAITTVVTLATVYYSGHLSDLIGRMRTLGLSGFSIAIALVLYSTASDIGPTLILASALIGLGWGLMYTLAPVVLTRLSATEKRVQVFSVYAVFMMSGFGLSPVFASWMIAAGYGISNAFLTVAILCAVSGALFYTLAGTVDRYTCSQIPNARSRLSLAAVAAIFRSRAWLPVVMVFLGASVFAGLNNFQTTIARSEGLNYADYFLTYTITTVICRIVFAGLSGRTSPYRVIGLLQLVMCGSAVLFLFINGIQWIYIACAILFGIGYGASYPILAAMAANDASEDLVPQTLQLFSLTYFIGIFGFPYIAGWLIVDFSINLLIVIVALLAAIEAAMALMRASCVGMDNSCS